jgi:F-box and WD-40 domain protein 1/11
MYTFPDIIAQLPQELSLAILCYLFSPSTPLSSSTNFSRGSSEITADDAMRALFTCLGVSRTWRRLASDNSVWKTAFLSRWVIDESRVEAFGPPLPRWSKTLSPHPMDSPAKQTGSFSRVRRLALSRSDSFSSLRRASSPSPVTSRPSTPCTPITPSSAFGPLNFDWKSLYQQRFQLERRWMNKSFEPKVTRIEGHTDSYGIYPFS